MSQCQKFSGMVVVPWFNRREWMCVYDKIYSYELASQLEALEILKIWKLRTPILSAGVEGSLIILEALTSNENLSDDQIVQIYSISLLRFLNVCAANNEKQGTFYTTAMEYGLPKWLISLRHDIAHDHKLPSKCVLKLGLLSCLNWLKVKYWEAQKEYISDLVMEDTGVHERIEELLDIYLELKCNSSPRKKPSQSLKHRIERCLNEEFVNKDRTWAIQSVFAKIERVFSRHDLLAQLERILPDYIVNKCLLIQVSNIKEQLRIPSSLKQLYKELLKLIVDGSFLFPVIEKLHSVSLNTIINDSTRMFASVWIYEFYLALLKAKKQEDEDDPQFTDCLEFSSNVDYHEKSENFLKRILEEPNEYTLIFLKTIMKFNNYNEKSINDTINLVKQFIKPSGLLLNEQIYTVNDLDSVLSSENTETISESESLKNEIIIESKITRWRPVLDKTIYKDCPFGILPNQSVHSNPILNNLF